MQTLRPVILCGGPGSRLWPSSTPATPKPFLDLTGGASLFQHTVRRVSAVAGAAAPIIVAGVAHVGLIRRQLDELDMGAEIVAEPEGRDSAPAIVAASLLVARRDPCTFLLVVAADHHVPDEAAFAAGVLRGIAAAEAGRIVTFGVKPGYSSNAYGYIEPGDTLKFAHGLFRVKRFLEKPDRDRACSLIQSGCLWNSGNFLFRADVMVEEVETLAPGLLKAVRKALNESREAQGGVRLLGPSFREAPKVSIDIAVMEKTARAAVAPVSYEWSDLGAWDAVLAASPTDADGNMVIGRAVTSGTSQSLVRADPGMEVLALGMRGVAVVASPGRVLVCDLCHAGDLKPALQALAELKDGWRGSTLEQHSHRLTAWLFDHALPVWWCFGADHVRGGYHDRLTWDRRATDHPRRLRVQARQVFVFSAAGRMGWPGPWRAAVEHGLEHIQRAHRRADGLYRTLLYPGGAPLDEAAVLYDHAFVLLAWASAAHAMPERREALEAEAATLLERLHQAYGHDQGGFRATESGVRLEADPIMHLFEAALAWSEVSSAPRWTDLADDIAGHFLERMMDWDGGRIAEVFAPGWGAHPDRAGRIIKPGHQFEWAWLLDRWSRARADSRAASAAVRLYATGAAGIDARSGLTLDDVEANLSPAGPGSRLWPQTERIKAVLALEPEPAARLATADAAVRAMESYFSTETPGLWRDAPAGSVYPPEEAALASTLYHIVGAILAVREAAAGGAADSTGS